MADTSQKRVNFKQLGSSGLRRYGGYVYEEFMPNLRWPYAASVYQEMSDNDPVVGAILYLAEMLIRNAEWTTAPGGKTARDKEASEFLKSCMDDMDTSWADTICEILSMLSYGFSFHEIVYKIRRGPTESNGKYRSKYNDGKIGWRRLPVRAQSTLHEWEFDEDGDIKAFVQLAPPDYKVIRIPLEKGLLFRTRVQRDNPEGKSLLRNAYRPWYFKKHIEEIEGIGIERDLAGLPVMTAPEGLDLWSDDDPRMTALRENAEALIRSIRRDSEEGILLPHGWELKLLATGSARQFDTNAIINRYDNRIAITMLSDLILIGGEKTGSFAMAETKQSILATALEAQLQNIADVFNKYAVPKLMIYNGFTDVTDYPKLVPGQIETPGIKEIALLLRSMGLDVSKDRELQNYLRKISNMPQISEKDFEDIYAPKEPVDPNEPNVAQHVSADDSKKVPPNQDPRKVNNDDTVDNSFEQGDLYHGAS